MVRRPGGKYRRFGDSVNGYIKINANKMLAKWEWIEAYWGVGKGEEGLKGGFWPQKSARGPGRPAGKRAKMEDGTAGGEVRGMNVRGIVPKTHFPIPLTIIPLTLPRTMCSTAWAA
jgi:hypothetical protein